MNKVVPTRRTRRRGVFLIEMISYLVIMAGVSLVVGDLINLLMKTVSDTAQRDTMIARVDSAMDMLRRDAWGAQAIRPTADGVEFEQPGGTITWKSTPGELSRVAGGTSPPRAWIDMPPMKFTSKGPAILVLQIESGLPGGSKQEEITFTSQRLLAGGAP